MAVFVATSDESGAHDPRQHFLVGGYVGPEINWPSVAKAWQERVLDGPPRIPQLHMREIRNLVWREKHGVSLRDAERRIDQAVDVLVSSGFLSAVVSVIQEADLREVFHPEYRQRGIKPDIGMDQPDYFCFLAYAYTTLEHISWRHPEAGRIDFVVALNGKITESIRTFHEEMKALVEPPLRDLVGGLYPAQPEDILGLQAADLLCWHWQRYLACGSQGSKMNRTDERRFALLVQASGRAQTWKREALEGLAKKFFH